MENTQLTTAMNSNSNLSIFTDEKRFEIAGKMAQTLAKSTIVPKEYQGNACNAMVAIEMAARQGTSPLMVMQNLNVIYGRPSWSAQYIIGVINASGRYDFELQFDEKEKNGKPFSCTCWTEQKGRKVVGPTVDMDLANAEGWVNKTGSKWKTMPQMMLRYRAASFFGRMNCPELMLGLQTTEEVYDVEYREVGQANVEISEANSVEFNAEAVQEAVKQGVKQEEVKQEKVKQEKPKEKVKADVVKGEKKDSKGSSKTTQKANVPEWFGG